MRYISFYLGLACAVMSFSACTKQNEQILASSDQPEQQREEQVRKGIKFQTFTKSEFRATTNGGGIPLSPCQD